METEKIAVLLGALILAVGCIGDKSDVEVQSDMTQTTIKEDVRTVRQIENNTYMQRQRQGMGDRNESLAEMKERLGLPENATDEGVREALQEMRGNGSRLFRGRGYNNTGVFK